METNLKEIYKTLKDKEVESIHTKIKTFMKEILKMMFLREKEN